VRLAGGCRSRLQPDRPSRYARPACAPPHSRAPRRPARTAHLNDSDHAGAGAHVRIPYRGRGKPASQKDANRAHAQLWSPGERANAQLKTWRIERKLRCCPWRAGNWPRPSTSFRPARSKD